MLNKIVSMNYTGQNGMSVVQKNDFMPIKIGFLGAMVNFAELADKDNSGTLNNETEINDFKERCKDYGWAGSYIEDMINSARNATKKLQDFLSKRNNSQHRFEYSLGQGIAYNDGSFSEECAQILKKYDKNNSGYLEEGQEINKAMKALKKKTGTKHALTNKSEEGEEFSNCIVIGTNNGYIMHKYQNTYVIDNATGEKVLYDRELIAAYEDCDGDGKFEIKIERK